MSIHFHKYQATGNDFILIDNRLTKNKFTKEHIEKICDRRFGVGADGLILIEEAEDADFEMIYYNSDGSQSLCGNGCRAAVDFASSLNIISNHTSFRAYDGIHEALRLDDQIIKLKMNDVGCIESFGNDYFIDTGSPHYIQFVNNLRDVNVVQQGRDIRNRESFKPGGTNVNFVELLPHNTIAVRTYERGVEDETLSCGTGVTAAALAVSTKGYQSPVNVSVRGGKLSVEFKSIERDAKDAKNNNGSCAFIDVFLIGPAKMVFEGDLEL
ncbi:MAG TPA: diaminopimelate epimerase [Cyclobacteriaceae bacterium]